MSAVRAHHRAGDELPVFPLVEPLHLRGFIRMLAEFMFDVHEDVYNFHEEKGNLRKEREDSVNL